MAPWQSQYCVKLHTRCLALEECSGQGWRHPCPPTTFYPSPAVLPLVSYTWLWSLPRPPVQPWLIHRWMSASVHVAPRTPETTILCISWCCVTGWPIIWGEGNQKREGLGQKRKEVFQILYLWTVTVGHRWLCPYFGDRSEYISKRVRLNVKKIFSSRRSKYPQTSEEQTLGVSFLGIS